MTPTTSVQVIERPPNIPLDHQLFSKGEWRRAHITEHPRVPLKIALEKQPSRSIDVTAIADTGAQSDLWSLQQFLDAGFTMADLSPVSLSLNAANKSPIRIDGAFFAKLDGRLTTGKTVSRRSMIYVSQDVKSLYLSYDSMLELGIINSDFPKIGQFLPSPTVNNDSAEMASNVASTTIGSICGTTKDDGAICDCPRRTIVPNRPTSLPFPCKPENNEKMKDWLLKRYNSSTFNTCPHQRLPCMVGPPVEIHLQDGA